MPGPGPAGFRNQSAGPVAGHAVGDRRCRLDSLSGHRALRARGRRPRGLRRRRRSGRLRSADRRGARGAHVVAIDVDPARLERLAPHGLELALDASASTSRSCKRGRRGASPRSATCPAGGGRSSRRSGTPAGQATAFGLLGRAATSGSSATRRRRSSCASRNLMALDATAQGQLGLSARALPSDSRSRAARRGRAGALRREPSAVRDQRDLSGSARRRAGAPSDSRAGELSMDFKNHDLTERRELARGALRGARSAPRRGRDRARAAHRLDHPRQPAASSTPTPRRWSRA